MNYRIVAVGKIKHSYITDGVRDFRVRLSKYAKVEIVEVKDEKTAENAAEEALLIKKEGERLLGAIGDGGFVVCLDMHGARLSTEQFADFLRQKKMAREKELVFVIGGSAGLSGEVLARANFTLSFSDFTFPHGLIRLILLEQLYRAEKILAGEPYHK